MNRRARAGAPAGLLVAVAIAFVPLPGGAYVRSVVPHTDICLFWNARQLPWTMNELGVPGVQGEPALAALRASFDTWQAVECSDVTFVELGTSPRRVVGYDRNDTSNEDLLLFREDTCDEKVPNGDPCWTEAGGCSNAWDCWDFSEGVIAVTTTTFNETTGEIVDADIEFNSRAFRFTAADGPPCATPDEQGCVATDIQNTATHEIGHFLGLDHTPFPEATMAASAPLGETSKRTLEQDDLDGFCAIYPQGGDTSVCVANFGLKPTAYSDGCPGCSAGAGPGSWLALVGLALLRLARSRSGSGSGSGSRWPG